MRYNSRMTEDRTPCRTPNADGVTNIPTWKFEAIRIAILAAVDDAGPEGLPFSKVAPEVKARLSGDQLSELGSVGWHATLVKLELEVRGEIARVSGVSPQRIVRS